MQQNITVIRRVRKSDNNRIARAVGATIVNRVEDLREADVGMKCGLFHIEKFGDEWVLPFFPYLLSPGFPHSHSHSTLRTRARAAANNIFRCARAASGISLS